MIIGSFFRRYMPILLLVVFTLPSCKREQIQLHIRPLTALIDYSDTSQGITLRVKKLDQHDCELLLGANAKRLFKRFRKRQPIWPIQFSITNESNKLIALRTSDISLKQLTTKQVASRLHKNSLTQILGTFASSLFIGGFLAMGSLLALSASGIILLTTGSLSITAPFAVTGISAVLAVPAFLIVGAPILSTVRGVQASHSNKTITRDIKQYSVKDQMVISPHTTQDAIIFVSRPDYRPTFTVKVSHPENASEKILFHVSIPESPYTIKQ